MIFKKRRVDVVSIVVLLILLFLIGKLLEWLLPSPFAAMFGTAAGVVIGMNLSRRGPLVVKVRRVQQLSTLNSNDANLFYDRWGLPLRYLGFYDPLGNRYMFGRRVPFIGLRTVPLTEKQFLKLYYPI